MPPYPVQYRRYASCLRNCRRMLHVKNAATAASVYALNMAIVVIVVCAWKIVTNGSHHDQLREVYYGVQIAYLAVLGTQIGLLVLSMMLLIGILKEYVGMVSPWVLGCILFMAVEAVCTVYANVLRDQVNREFDALCRAEVAFFLTRVLLNSLAIVAVLRFYRRLRDGFSWKDPEEIEL